MKEVIPLFTYVNGDKEAGWRLKASPLLSGFPKAAVITAAGRSSPPSDLRHSGSGGDYDAETASRAAHRSHCGAIAGLGSRGPNGGRYAEQ